MKTAIRTYRLPIMVTGLLLVALAFWAGQQWQAEAKHRQEKEIRHAMGILGTIEGAMRAFGYSERLQQSQLESMLQNIMQVTSLRFVVLEQDGRRVFQTQEAPAELALHALEGERFAESGSLFWRKIDLHGGGDGKQVLVLGFDPPPPDRPGALEATKSIFTTLSIAALFVLVSLVAWVMSIRSHLLTEQLETERIRRAHLEELGLAAAGLAHETKNPLGIILGLAQQVAGNPDEPAESRTKVEHIIDEVDRASARLGSFMSFARQREARVKSLDIRMLGSKIAAVLGPDFGTVGVELTLSLPSLQILADEEMLQQILVNLLLNSLHASPAGTGVTVRAERDGEAASIRVTDQGSGIAPELLPNVFKPYVTGRPRGHGLGLAVVKRNVEEHGWTIEIDSRPGRGTEVVVSGIRLGEDEGGRA